MKNKRIISKTFSVIMLTGLSLGSVNCTGDYIGDVENIGSFDDVNYFKTEDQCLSATSSVYDKMKK